jgi:HK97 family phage portal protein
MSEERVVSDLVWTPERGGEIPEVRGISWENFLLSDDKYLGKWKTDSGIRITPETALQSTVVLSCCRILAETVCGLPLHVYRRNPDGGDEIAKEIPLYKILTFRPNDWQTKPEFFEQIVMNLTLWGNSYTRIRSGQYGSVSCLDNLHPSRMDVERLENGRLRYSYTDPETGRLERYTQDQIMHIRWTPEQDGIKGMVPVEIAREAIGLARACEQHAARFWANSARPGVVLQTEGTLNAEAAERLRDNWERLHRGSERAFKTAVLTGGMKAVELGMTNESSQFVASRDFQTAEICRVYRIAQHLIQGTPGGDLEVQGQEFVTYTLMPWLTRIESAISRSLIYNDDEYYAKFDVRGLLRANSQQRASYYSTMTSLGIMTINDCRRAEGLKPLGEIGDHHFVAMNMQTLEDATKPKPEAPPPGMPGGGGDGPPPPAPGGPPSLPEVKTGKAPIASPKGEASQPKEEEAIEEYSADWEDAIEARAFCATGEGHGTDNSCSSSGAGVAEGFTSTFKGETSLSS